LGWNGIVGGNMGVLWLKGVSWAGLTESGRVKDSRVYFNSLRSGGEGERESVFWEVNRGSNRILPVSTWEWKQIWDVIL